MIEVGSDFSGIGAFEQSLIRLGLPYKNVFSCDMDKFARKTFIENYGTEADKEIVNSKEHDALCDEMVKYVNSKKLIYTDDELNEFLNKVEVLARSFSFYYPLNVNHRQIPEKPLGVYMTSPPCQGFSMAGKRKGSNLFMNSLEFIRINGPRYFIFENVKGLLSHDKEDKDADYGRTFNLWLNYLGGKSVNGSPVFFPFEDSVPYHIYHGVLNAKEHGVPQNRERVFIIGIRDDSDNFFQFPPTEYLQTKLKDVLEKDVPEKYYLLEEMIKGFIKSSEKHEEKGTGFVWQPKDLESDDVANCLRANASLCKTDNSIKVGFINQDSQASAVYSDEEHSPALSAGSKGYANGYVLVKSATPEGYKIAEPGDSINYQNKKSNTRRGRVGKEVSSTLDTTCTVGVIEPVEPKIGAVRGNRPDKHGKKSQQALEINESGVSNSLTSVQKDNYVIEGTKIVGYTRDRKTGEVVNRSLKDEANTIHTATGGGGNTDQYVYESDGCYYRIRRLTPRECIRLMDFPDSFKLPCSDTQTYKQAGNSIVVAVLAKQLGRFKFN